MYRINVVAIISLVQKFDTATIQRSLLHEGEVHCTKLETLFNMYFHSILMEDLGLI